MLTLYVICAGLGTVIMLVQLLLLLLGMDFADADLDVPDVDFDGLDADLDGLDADDAGAHHGSSWFFGVVSLRTMVAALAFFGWAGIATSSSGMSAYSSILLSIVAGGTAMVAMAWLMRSLHRLRAEGNVQIQNAVGQPATVYLTVPAGKSGVGKVTVRIQDRTMEYQAMTAAQELATGSPVTVVGVLGTDILEVAPASDREGD